MAPGDRIRTCRGSGHVLGVCAGGRLWVRVEGEAGAWFVGSSAGAGGGAVGAAEGAAAAAALDAAAAAAAGDVAAADSEGGAGAAAAAAAAAAAGAWPLRLDQFVLLSRGVWAGRNEGDGGTGVAARALDAFIEGGGGGGSSGGGRGGGGGGGGDDESKVVDVLESKSAEPDEHSAQVARVDRAAFAASLARHFGYGSDAPRGGVALETANTPPSPAARLAADAALVWAWSDLAERRGVDPFNVRPATLLCAGCGGGDSDAGVLARGAALRVLNAAAPHILHVSAAPAPRCGDDASCCEPLRASDAPVGGGGGGGIAADLSAGRGLIFTATKRVHAARVLSATARRPRPAEDEYDYPEGLPILTLNRPLAAAARESADAPTRLRHSMLGQAAAALAPLGPGALRTSYSHPMDDGQVTQHTAGGVI